ncbi:MAG: LytTR family transcriptional regulator [Rhodobacteraceae bacterium]|nr:LytTR family transcriptional regulator [Paracoccaceae bacterium]
MLGDLKAALLHPATLVVWAVLSVWLTLSGPFATYEAASLAQRAFYWPLVAGLGVVAGVSLRLAIRRRMPYLSYWQASAISASTLSVVLAVPAARLTAAMAGQSQDPGAVPSGIEAAGAIFAVAIGMNALRYVLSPGHARSAPPAPPLPVLLDRLAVDKRAPVIRLSSSDHYVRVVTELGEEEVLIRFADAIAELEGAQGLRVHRSHWVAIPAVRGHVTEKGRVFVITTDGARVPVSRSYRAEVEAQGLLRDA